MMSLTQSTFGTDYLRKYLLRFESQEERKGMPVPTKIEQSQAYQLVPETPLMLNDATKYGALMFALGRRQVTLEVEGWLKENGL